MIHFPTDYDAIKYSYRVYNPANYAKTRNFLDGNVSSLCATSPVGDSTRMMYDSLLKGAIDLKI